MPNLQAAERVAIFIDGSNLYHSLEENCGRYDVDFAALSLKLAGGRQLLRTYYYNLLREQERNPQAYSDQQKFLTALHSTRFLEVRLGGAKMRGDWTVEKGVDIMIATDMLNMAWEDRYDTAILVSGDGDFAYAAQAVKNLGKHVLVAAFQPNLSGELVQVCDDRIILTADFFEDLWSRRRVGDRYRGRRLPRERGGAPTFESGGRQPAAGARRAGDLPR